MSSTNDRLPRAAKSGSAYRVMFADLPITAKLLALKPKQRVAEVHAFEARINAKVERTLTPFGLRVLGGGPGDGYVDVVAPKRVLAKLRAIRGVVFVMEAPADVAERSGVRAGGRARKAKPLAGCYAVTVTLATRVEGQRTGLQWIQDTTRLVYADDVDEAVELARACCLESCYSTLTEDGRFASITLEGVKDFVPLFEETVLRRVPDGTEIGWRLSRRRLNASRLWRPEHVKLARR